MRRWHLFWLLVCLAVAFPAALAAKSKSGEGGKGGGHGAATEHKQQVAPQPPDEIVLPPLFKPPFELVRRLEIVQDRITQGSREAHVYQRALIEEIALQFAKTPDGIWKQPRNARAVVTYVLSGGDPFILQRLVRLNDLGGGVTADVIKGLIAYSRGRNEEAFKLLSGVPASSLGSGAGGHLALAQATLATEDPAKALAYLDQARLMGPGTLVEEAALRRAVAIAAKSNNGSKFLSTTSQYLRRFYRSVYAPNFLRAYALGYATNGFGKDGPMRERLVAMLDRIPREPRKAAYLALAEASVLHGGIETARVASGKLVELAKNDPSTALRARLYGAAAGVVSDGYDLAVIELKNIDRTKLLPRDRDLLNAALALAVKLHAPLPEAGDEPPPPASAAQAPNGEMEDVSPAIVAGRKSIALADSLLNGTSK